GEDEWAITRASDEFVDGLKPHEAFSAITGILDLAKEQDDSYAFASCCWLVLQLAGKAQTTEHPEGLEAKLKELLQYSEQFGDNSQSEVKKIAAWFRITNII
ncbi:MAG: hypothetical protein WAS33_21785, partial [Candidatus Promineifilaceae bacterium]